MVIPIPILDNDTSVCFRTRVINVSIYGSIRTPCYGLPSCTYIQQNSDYHIIH